MPCACFCVVGAATAWLMSGAGIFPKLDGGVDGGIRVVWLRRGGVSPEQEAPRWLRLSCLEQLRNSGSRWLLVIGNLLMADASTEPPSLAAISECSCAQGCVCVCMQFNSHIVCVLIVDQPQSLPTLLDSVHACRCIWVVIDYGGWTQLFCGQRIFAQLFCTGVDSTEVIFQDLNMATAYHPAVEARRGSPWQQPNSLLLPVSGQMKGVAHVLCRACPHLHAYM
jgi:hypothetical protein